MFVDLLEVSERSFVLVQGGLDDQMQHFCVTAGCRILFCNIHVIVAMYVCYKRLVCIWMFEPWKTFSLQCTPPAENHIESSTSSTKYTIFKKRLRCPQWAGRMLCMRNVIDAICSRGLNHRHQPFGVSLSLALFISLSIPPSLPPSLSLSPSRPPPKYSTYLSACPIQLICLSICVFTRVSINPSNWLSYLSISVYLPVDLSNTSVNWSISFIFLPACLF